MRCLLLFFPLFTALTAVGQDVANGRSPNDQHTLTLYIENDLFANTDRYYSNGVRLSYLSPDLEALALPGWAQEVKSWFWLLNQPGYTNNFGLALGQNMYTPEDTQNPNFTPNDRPYAGWLYGALSLHHKNADTLHMLELTVGIVGPSALGEEAQNGVHNFRSLPTTKGWAWQLHDEPGLILTYEYRLRCELRDTDSLWGADLLPGISLSAGNVLTQAAAGVTLRAGYNVPRDFHGNRIRVAGYALAPDAAEVRERDRRLSVYLFVSAEQRYVAHNIFLDGNTWQDSPSVDRIPWVTEYEAGIGLRYGRYRLTYAQVLQTPEFEQQDGRQQFGTLSASVSF